MAGSRVAGAVAGSRVAGAVAGAVAGGSSAAAAEGSSAEAAATGRLWVSAVVRSEGAVMGMGGAVMGMGGAVMGSGRLWVSAAVGGIEVRRGGLGGGGRRGSGGSRGSSEARLDVPVDSSNRAAGGAASRHAARSVEFGSSAGTGSSGSEGAVMGSTGPCVMGTEGTSESKGSCEEASAATATRSAAASFSRTYR